MTVDCTPTLRKYVRYGSTLIGYTHGNEEKPADLPKIMAQERKSDWGETTYHEWRLGHNHRAKKVEFVSMDTDMGCEIRWLRSLSATDAWHYAKGYVGTRRAAESFLTCPVEGFRTNSVVNARE